ncbi:GtrA family protein [Candidatus Pelagibacter sp.]|nr:GtrA family protein [Candidatus Pelagibacter sp.]
MILKIDGKKKRYLIIGLINTIFGYFIGILNYILFYKLIGIFFLSLLNNIVSITFSFLTYKYFVFKTKNKFFLSEYLKSYIVYGISFIVGTFFLWLTLEVLKLDIFIAQFITISLTVIFSYIGNNYFTFKEK